jgi:DNA-binding beta-propeller fold protein YncE
MQLRLMFMMGLLAVGPLGCAADSASESPDNKGAPKMDGSTGTQCHGANDCPPGYLCNAFGYCSQPGTTSDGGLGDAALPPEVEQDKEPPASGKVYVYVAVPEQDMVAKIHSTSLQVRAIKVGKDPGALRTLQGQDVAVVLGKLSSTATILRSRTDGGDDITTLKTAAGLNQLVVAPGGKYAVAYFDVNKSKGKIDPKQSFQEITVLRLESGKEQAVDLSVGFRPSSVQFSSDGAKAFVITDKGISMVNLAAATKPAIIPTIPVLGDPLKEPTPDEVLVTPDGARALIRLGGLKGIRVLDMATKALTDLTLGAEPTDIDLTADGKLAVVVLRDSKQVALLDIPADLQDPTGVDTLTTAPYTAGQSELSADGKQAFLFTNATAQEVLLTADLTTRKLGIYPLKKGVRSVLSSPDGKRAVVLHNKVPGTPKVEDGFETYVDKSYGYSLLDLAASFDKLQLTGADPGEVAFAADSLTAYLLLSDTKAALRSVETIDLSSFMVKSVGLGSHPVALGVIDATGTVYVAQSHPLGRVTFVDIKTHGTKTVTGFELNSHIID